jgi:predicted neutral ceramidase superfamily lipid hydrolase
MKFINLIIAILTTIFLLMLNHKSKTKGKKTSELSPFQAYQRNLVPFTATIFTLAAYSLTGTINNLFGESLLPSGLTSMFDIIFAKKANA